MELSHRLPSQLTADTDLTHDLSPEIDREQAYVQT